MEPKTPKLKRIALPALALIVGAGVLREVAAAVAEGPDVRNVVETAYRLRGEACTEGNREHADTFKRQLAQYWSDAPPRGAELEARLKVSHQRGPVAGWSPYESPLDARQAEIDECIPREVSPSPGALPKSFGVSAFKYKSVVINGTRAHVAVNIEQWADYALPTGGVHRHSSVLPYTFELTKEDGDWTLAREEEQGPRLAP